MGKLYCAGCYIDTPICRLVHSNGNFSYRRDLCDWRNHWLLLDGRLYRPHLKTSVCHSCDRYRPIQSDSLVSLDSPSWTFDSHLYIRFLCRAIQCASSTSDICLRDQISANYTTRHAQWYHDEPGEYLLSYRKPNRRTTSRLWTNLRTSMPRFLYDNRLHKLTLDQTKSQRRFHYLS